MGEERGYLDSFLNKLDLPQSLSTEDKIDRLSQLSEGNLYELGELVAEELQTSEPILVVTKWHIKTPHWKEQMREIVEWVRTNSYVLGFDVYYLCDQTLEMTHVIAFKDGKLESFNTYWEEIKEDIQKLFEIAELGKATVYGRVEPGYLEELLREWGITAYLPFKL